MGTQKKNSNSIGQWVLWVFEESLTNMAVIASWENTLGMLAITQNNSRPSVKTTEILDAEDTFVQLLSNFRYTRL